MSGLKCLTAYLINRVFLSHPAWDEWIEILQSHATLKGFYGLIPLGMSGLKLLKFVKSVQI